MAKKQAEQPTPAPSEQSYAERTMVSIAKNAEARGIAAGQLSDVVAVVEKKYGKRMGEMNETELRRLNRELPSLLDQFTAR